MRRRIHAYEEEDTYICGGGYMHMRRMIHAYEEENTPLILVLASSPAFCFC
jgi:hypothetical protein